MQRRLFSRWGVGFGSLALLLGIAGVGAASAHAGDPVEPPASIVATYDVKGSTHLTKSGINVPLGPTKLTVNVGDSADFLASLPLPPKTVAFKAFGYLPVKAKVYFTEVGPVTGTLDFADGNTIVVSQARYVVTLRDVYVGGQAAKVGDNCQTRYPIEVNAGTNGAPFDLVEGGPLTATYDIGKFENCGTSTELANIIVPSRNNTLKLTLSNFYATGADQARLAKRVAAAK